MKIFLRLESVAVLLGLLLLYAHLHFSWITFAIFILSPDFFMIGYLDGPKVGAIVYNLAHGYFTPTIIFALSIFFNFDMGESIAIIWAIHISADRALGYGLKLPTGFKQTHLS